MSFPSSASPAPGPAGRRPPGTTPLGRVGGYALLSRIGEGGMGVVYLARGAGDRRVALKVLRPQLVGDEEGRERLAREVASLGKVRSPHVAEVLDADPWGETPYVVTRYVPGVSLHQHVRMQGPLDEDDLVHVARVLLAAVRDVHAADVLHRDVKPSNVLLEGRSPVLIDFGLARLAEDPRMTATGWLLGTPGYLAPELVYGDDASAASDVHAWAATLVYAASGASPYGSGHPIAILDRLRRGRPRLDEVPPSLRPLLAGCLAHDPLERPTTIEAADALAGLLVPRPPASDAYDARPAADGPPTAPPTVPWQVAMAADAAAAPTEAVPTTGSPAGEDHRPATAVPHSPTTPYTVVRPAPASPARPVAPAPPDPPWQPGPPPPASPAQALRRRCTLAGLLGTVAAGFAAAPAVCLVVVAVVVVLVRGQSRTAEAAWMRRLRRGRRRWYDPVLTVLGYPWHVLGGSVGSLVLVVSAAAGGLLTGAALLVLGMAAGTALAVGGLVLACALWWGPGSRRVREPVRRAADRSSRDPWVSAVVLVLVASTAMALLAYALARGPRRELVPPWVPASGQAAVTPR